MRVTAPINLTFSDDSAFLKKILGGGHKFSEFACFIWLYNPVVFDLVINPEARACRDAAHL